MSLNDSFKTLKSHHVSFQDWWAKLCVPLNLSPEQRQAELRLWIEFLKLPSYETLMYVYTPEEVSLAIESVWHQWQPLLEQRLNHRLPIQYLLGYAYFLDLKLEVQPPCLIPRPESELLCEAVVEEMLARVSSPPLNMPLNTAIWEVGIGTGCLSVGIAHLLRLRSLFVPQFFAGDICSTALELAKRNASTYQIPMTLFSSDLLQEFPLDLQAPQVLVANLPYIDPALYDTLQPEVLYHEGHHTLFAEEAGFSLLFRLIDESTVRFGPSWQGVLALEFGENMHDSLAQKLKATGLIHQRWLKDYQGIVRHVLASRFPLFVV
jgi:release factor glutamine methyltransferase